VLVRWIAIRRAETVGAVPQRSGQCGELRFSEGAQRPQFDLGPEPHTHCAHLGDASGEAIAK